MTIRSGPKNWIPSDKTEMRRIEQHRDRWSTFGETTGIVSLSEKLSPEALKKYEIFRDYDEKFLEQLSPDISVAAWKKGAVLFEEGTYIDLAFFVVAGAVEMNIDSFGSDGTISMPIFDQDRTMVLGPNPDLSKESGADSQKRPLLRLKPLENNTIAFLNTVDTDLPRGKSIRLGVGEVFGEIGALSGWPQSATVRSASECTLVQIRVPALRAMKRKSTAFKNQIDKVYRERSLLSQLKVTPMFRTCKPIFVEALQRVVELVSCEPGEVVSAEGEPADALYVVRSGFIKLSQKFGQKEMVVSYLSKGMSFGEVELLLDDLTGREMTATSVEHTELIKIPRNALESLLRLHPEVEQHLWRTAAERIKESGYSKRNITHSEFTQTAVESGLVQANSLLVIDLNTCVRCDDCVRGCADAHGGRPRFIREGSKYENLLIPKSCYHCRDPVCLVGCPTGAIHRAGKRGVVKIDDQICIGCSTCANSCPYNAIVMHQTGEVWPEDMVPISLRGNPRRVASKCDLCYDAGHEPACVSNCPQGSTIRIGNIDKFQDLLARKGTAGAAAPKKSPETAKKRAVIPWSFLFGAIAVLATFFVNIAVGEVRSGNAWGLTYGYAAATFLVLQALLGGRQRIMRWASKYRFGRSDAWLQIHLYGGGLFLLLMFMHSGFHLPTGFLTGAVWWLALWVVLSGVAGRGLQKWIPKLLASLSIEVIYERIPELIEEIRERAEKIVDGCEEPVKTFCRKKFLPAFAGPGRNFIFFVDITGGLRAHLRESDYLKGFLESREKEKLEELLRLYKTKVHIDAHYTLQQILRWWPVLHLPASILLIVFVMLHLLSVFYF